MHDLVEDHCDDDHGADDDERGPDDSVPVVAVDQHRGAAAATRHRLDPGHLRQDFSELGRSCLHLLLEQIESGRRSCSRVVVEAERLRRKSTAAVSRRR
ncbi:hypothetical protein WMF28_22945 [Sorangium sp. So ce590]|uniref:hypothetical protein n=1 Tax=Sorangium sp. So ce590 TaxID=3133317 RepID=UPI003F610AA4